MTTTTEQLERRLARVEKELAELRQALAAKSAEPWYRQIVGSFADDPAFAEILRLGCLSRAGKQAKASV